MTLASLEQLLAEIAPELAAVDTRLEWLAPEWPITQQLAAEGAYACTIRGPFPELKVQWESVDSWTGAWPNVIAFIEADMATPGTLCHEAAHLLPATPPMPDTGVVEARPEEFHEWRERYVAATSAPVVPWADHGAAWTRRALHLWFRSIQAGHAIDLDDVFIAGDRYGLSPALDYAISLKAELEDLEGCSFALIEATAPPQEFVQLFVRDAATWAVDNGHAHLFLPKLDSVAAAQPLETDEIRMRSFIASGGRLEFADAASTVQFGFPE